MNDGRDFNFSAIWPILQFLGLLGQCLSVLRWATWYLEIFKIVCSLLTYPFALIQNDFKLMLNHFQVPTWSMKYQFFRALVMRKKINYSATSAKGEDLLLWSETGTEKILKCAVIWTLLLAKRPNLNLCSSNQRKSLLLKPSHLLFDFKTAKRLRLRQMTPNYMASLFVWNISFWFSHAYKEFKVFMSTQQWNLQRRKNREKRRNRVIHTPSRAGSATAGYYYYYIKTSKYFWLFCNDGLNHVWCLMSVCSKLKIGRSSSPKAEFFRFCPFDIRVCSMHNWTI